MTNRIESDKEDLITEAVALVHRAEFRWVQSGQTTVWSVATAGFRKDGCCSVYLDQNPFYQFDDAGLLRRAHVDGDLYRCGRDSLSRLHRTRSETQTVLQNHSLTPIELTEFQRSMKQQIALLLNGLRSGDLKRGRSVCWEPNIETRLDQLLTQVLSRNDQFWAPAISVRE